MRSANGSAEREGRTFLTLSQANPITFGSKITPNAARLSFRLMR